MSAPLVEIADLEKRFPGADGGTTALDGVSATVPEGAITGLIGPDGAGKTTLMRLVAGLLLPDRGAVRVFGRPAAALGPSGRLDLGYLPQGTGLYDDLSVDENLRLHADLRGLRADERARRGAELLDRLGLGPFRARPAGKLSGGMAQKLALACALVAPPRLLLLDEPSMGVDPLSRRELWEIVRPLPGEGIAVLWSTAYLDEAERCDRVIVLAGGRAEFEGRPDAFTARIEGRTHRLEAPGTDLRPVQRRAVARADVLDAVLRTGGLDLVTAGDAAAPEALARDLVPDGEARIAPAEPRFGDALIATLAARRGDTAPPEPGHGAAAPARDGPAIRAGGLVRRFGAFTAVAGVDFEVAPGEVFGLLGANGAGKSTIFRMLCGLLPPTAGRAEVAGRDVSRAGGRARARIGYMAQHFSLYAELSVRRNLAFFAAAYGLDRRRRDARIAGTMEAFGLEPHAASLAGALPLGLKQRLALAAAVLHEPDILFLDEPTSGVDPLVRREFWLRINAMAERGVAVLVTTHFMEEAEQCARVAIVERGRVIATGAPREIAEAHGGAEGSVEAAFVSLVRARREEEAGGAATGAGAPGGGRAEAGA